MVPKSNISQVRLACDIFKLYGFKCKGMFFSLAYNDMSKSGIDTVANLLNHASCKLLYLK